MRKPQSVLRDSARRVRRPSPAMAVASVALFMSLGGVGYAAVALPAHSVGPAQLRTFAVTNPKLANDSVGYRKIMPGSVGTVRIDKNDVQLRVTGTCTLPNQAMTSININGGVTCGSTSPTESDTGTGAVKPIATTATALASFALAGGSPYFVQADPYITVSANTDTSAQTVDVSCTLASGTATTATETRTVSLYVPAGQAASTSIPLTVMQPESPNSTTATVSCMDTDNGGITDATLNGQATIYALTLAPPPSTTTTTATTTTATTTTASTASVRR